MINKIIKFSDIINAKNPTGINTNHYQQAVKLKKALHENCDTPWRISVGHFYLNNEKTVFINNGEILSIDECLAKGYQIFQLSEVDMEKYLSEQDKADIDYMYETQQNNKIKNLKAQASNAEKKLKNKELNKKIAEIYANKKDRHL